MIRLRESLGLDMRNQIRVEQISLASKASAEFTLKAESAQYVVS